MACSIGGAFTLLELSHFQEPFEAGWDEVRGMYGHRSAAVCDPQLLGREPWEAGGGAALAEGASLDPLSAGFFSFDLTLAVLCPK